MGTTDGHYEVSFFYFFHKFFLILRLLLLWPDHKKIENAYKETVAAREALDKALRKSTTDQSVELLEEVEYLRVDYLNAKRKHDGLLLGYKEATKKPTGYAQDLLILTDEEYERMPGWRDNVDALIDLRVKTPEYMPKEDINDNMPEVQVNPQGWNAVEQMDEFGNMYDLDGDGNATLRNKQNTFQNPETLRELSVREKVLNFFNNFFEEKPEMLDL